MRSYNSGIHKAILEELVKKAAKFYSINPNDVYNKSHKRELSETRKIIMFSLKCLYPKLSWANIGAVFIKDHSTALLSYKSISNLRQTEPKLNEFIDILIEDMREFIDNFKIASSIFLYGDIYNKHLVFKALLGYTYNGG